MICGDQKSTKNLGGGGGSSGRLTYGEHMVTYGGKLVLFDHISPKPVSAQHHR